MSNPDLPLAPDKQGIPLVCEAVTMAATLLSRIENAKELDERDRNLCHRTRKLLERAETVLYGKQE